MDYMRTDRDLGMVRRRVLDLLSWRSLGILAAAVLIAAALDGCGSTSGTATSSHPSTSTTSPASAATPTTVPESIIASAEHSITPVACGTQNTDTGDRYSSIGTGFQTPNGIVTASHVVADCAPTAGGQAVIGGRGEIIARVEGTDPSHDVAIMQSSGWLRPLNLATAPAYVGEPVALIGIPGSTSYGGNPLQFIPVQGTVIKIGTTETLTLPSGIETLSDAIDVSAAGVAPGYSGGSAVDAAGNVVGVIEGSTSQVVSLTPASDVVSLQNALAP